MSKPTLIVQSYRPEMPPWIETCLRRVEGWARGQGYAYEFVGDELFDFVPERFGAVPASAFKRVTLTDWARLGLIRQRLASGRFAHVVWLDADLLLFDPVAFRLSPAFLAEGRPEHTFLGCHEVWHEFSALFYHHLIHKVNNAILGFGDVASVDLVLGLSERVLALSRPDQRAEVIMGTRLLTKLHQSVPFHLQRGVACIGPLSFAAWQKSPRGYGHRLSQAYRAPVLAANLCRSKAQSDAEMLVQVKALIEGAASFNQGESRTLPNLTRLSSGHLAFALLRDLRQKAQGVLRGSSAA